MTDHPDDRPPWWQTTLDRPPWWQTALMPDRSDDRLSLMADHPDDRPPWWQTTIMKGHLLLRLLFFLLFFFVSFNVNACLGKDQPFLKTTSEWFLGWSEEKRFHHNYHDYPHKKRAHLFLGRLAPLFLFQWLFFLLLCLDSVLLLLPGLQGIGADIGVASWQRLRAAGSGYSPFRALGSGCWTDGRQGWCECVVLPFTKTTCTLKAPKYHSKVVTRVTAQKAG